MLNLSPGRTCEGVTRKEEGWVGGRAHRLLPLHLFPGTASAKLGGVQERPSRRHLEALLFLC